MKAVPDTYFKNTSSELPSVTLSCVGQEEDLGGDCCGCGSRRMKDSAIVAVFFVASFPALVGLTIPTKKRQTYLEKDACSRLCKECPRDITTAIQVHLSIQASTVIVRLEAVEPIDLLLVRHPGTALTTYVSCQSLPKLNNSLISH